jgi:hypothetical protein
MSAVRRYETAWRKRLNLWLILRRASLKIVEKTQRENRKQRQRNNQPPTGADERKYIFEVGVLKSYGIH